MRDMLFNMMFSVIIIPFILYIVKSSFNAIVENNKKMMQDFIIKKVKEDICSSNIKDFHNNICEIEAKMNDFRHSLNEINNDLEKIENKIQEMELNINLDIQKKMFSIMEMIFKKVDKV